MVRVSAIRLLIVLMVAFAACKEPFDPKINPATTNSLVVEGYISANGPTTITLTRTLALKDQQRAKYETNAQVSVIAEDNSVYFLSESGNGVYVSNATVLRTNQKYRLHIKTQAGGEYLSEFVAVVPTPPIDDLTWTVAGDGVHIAISTHDPQNNTRYYKWDYLETWEIHSGYPASFKYVNGRVVATSLDEQQNMYYCWKNNPSAAILIGSTVQLENDVVNQAPLIFIENGSEKAGVRYSVLVKQSSLDKKGFEFYKMMKSNTETLGSIFDPLPSEITGNIICVSNPLEKVIGYISASTVSEKRLFITRLEAKSNYNPGCMSIFVPNNVDSFKVAYGAQGYLPYQQDPSPPNPPTQYYSSQGDCVDCRLRGGSSAKPSFW